MICRVSQCVRRIREGERIEALGLRLHVDDQVSAANCSGGGGVPAVVPSGVVSPGLLRCRKSHRPQPFAATVGDDELESEPQAAISEASELKPARAPKPRMTGTAGEVLRKDERVVCGIHAFCLFGVLVWFGTAVAVGVLR